MKGTLQKRQSVLCCTVRSNLILDQKNSALPENLGSSKFNEILMYCDKILWKIFIFRPKKAGNCLSLLPASLYILILVHILHNKAFRSSSNPRQHHVKLCLAADRPFTPDMICQNILCSFMFYW